MSHGVVYISRKRDMLPYKPRAFAMNMCAVNHRAQPCPKWSYKVFNGVILDIVI